MHQSHISLTAGVFYNVPTCVFFAFRNFILTTNIIFAPCFPLLSLTVCVSVCVCVHNCMCVSVSCAFCGVLFIKCALHVLVN